MTMGQGDKKRDKNLAVPADVIRYADLYYGKDVDRAAAASSGERKWNLLDVYRPKERAGILPVIINVHGGGWVYGTKEVYQFYGMNLAQRGFAVVNFNYGLAPEHRFPSQLEAVNHAVQWILAHEQEYGFDAEHIFMVGDSAGAHLLTLYAAMCVNADYAATFDFEVPDGFVPTALALNCGVYDIPKLMETNGGQMKPLMRDLLGKKDFEKKLETVNALAFLTKDFPPSFIMSATGDFLQGQAPLMRDKLESLGVPYRFKIYGNEEEKPGHVFHCDIKLSQAEVCNDEECGFFKSFL